MSEDPAGRQPEPPVAVLDRRQDRQRIVQEIRARYAARLAAADICDSLSIEAQIRAEIERALAGPAPPGALGPALDPPA